MEMGIGAGWVLCRFSDPQMVGSRRDLRNSRPVSNYADEEEGPSIACLSDFWKVCGDVVLTQQLGKE